MSKDMGDPKKIAALRRLLSLFDGVVVESVWCRPSGDANITLCITCMDSTGRLASCAQNANLGFLVWAERARDDSPGTSWADRVRYELRAGPDPEGAEYAAVERLCAFMVRDLTGRRLLDSGEAEMLLGAWDEGP
jgi:hypothetical protein